MTNIESATAWGNAGRDAVEKAKLEIKDGRMGTAHYFRILADECFAKEKALRELPDQRQGEGRV